MTFKTPAAARALRGFKTRSFSRQCPITGRVQPSFPLALAYAFNLQSHLGPVRVSIRRASAQARPASAPSVTKYTVGKSSSQDDLVEQINPPSSTLPAPLDFPERNPDQSAPGYWFGVGKAFWKFYKQGVKNIYANRNAAKQIRAKRAREADENTLAKSLPTLPGAIKADSWTGGLTRSEWQLEMRSTAEMRRVPIFAVILAVFGEWTPLLVMFATPIVPYNCRIPRQIRKSREKAETRRSRSFRGAYLDIQNGQSYVPKPADVRVENTKDGNILRTPITTTLHLCRTLNIYPAWMDVFALSSISARFWFVFVWNAPAKLSKYLHEYIVRDDSYLFQHGAMAKVPAMKIPSFLRDEEVLIAAEQRGIDVLSRPLADVRYDLGMYLDILWRQRCAEPDIKSHFGEIAQKLLLMRPNQWEEIRRKLPRVQ